METIYTRDYTKDMEIFHPGWVWLAGAGPGAVGLVTLKTLQGLAQADVILHDALVSDEILGKARDGAIVEFAGRRCQGRKRAQEDVVAQMIALAREDKRVLRLKGGDPCIFGRGAEEAQALAQAGVPFCVVPGVTAGIGGLEAAGIAPTHRDVNHAVVFLTGHPAQESPARWPVDWTALSQAAPILVIYMGLASLESIARHLLAAGRRPEETVTVVSKATLPEQKVLETTLSQAVADVEHAGLEPPAMIVVGPVARFPTSPQVLS